MSGERQFLGQERVIPNRVAPSSWSHVESRPPQVGPWIRYQTRASARDGTRRHLGPDLLVHVQAQHVTLAIESERVAIAGGQAHGTAQLRDLNRTSGVYNPTRAATTPHWAPAPHRSIGGKRRLVRLTDGDGDDVGDA